MKLHGSSIEDISFTQQQRLLSQRDVKVVFDVGANVGNTVARYRDLFPWARIYAFEPFPEACKRLRARFDHDALVHCECQAVSSKTGTTRMYVNDYADTNSLLPRPHAARRYWAADNRATGEIPVPTITLDEFAAAQNPGQIGILKMDIQGGEGEVLRGAD